MERDKDHFKEHRKRLRNRFRRSGAKALQDYEILEMLLGYAIPRRDTKPLAKRVIGRFGSLQAVFDRTYEELECIEGIGEYAGTLIALVKACTSRYMEPGKDERAVMENPDAVIRHIRAEIGSLAREQFMLLCLNAANRLTHTEIISQGTVDMAHVYPREIIRTAIVKNASALILVHNHPSGSLKPSAHDERLTRDLTEMCSGLGIQIHDHIIVTRDQAYSIKLGRRLP